MEVLKRKYIIDEKNRKIAVQLDIKTFQQIEEIVENFALYHLMKESEHDEKLDMQAAKEYYSRLEKAD